MDTLRSFVDAFLEPGTFHSKPDTIADSYELRRLKLRRADPEGDRHTSRINAQWPETLATPNLYDGEQPFMGPLG